MTLLEMQQKVLRLIEEVSTNSTKLTDDPDIAEKLNEVIDQIQNELTRTKKIPTYTEESVSAGDEINLSESIDDFYQLNTIRYTNEDGEYLEYEIYDNLVIFPEDGIAKIYYYKYPEKITKETAGTYEFELSNDALECMPYGVAADVLKSDVSSNYGQIYAQRYEMMIQRLDTRYNTGSIYIEVD